ncbi:MAG: radical SAM protein [Clostridia bacterium]|nr:radical SAM protein [Clostridia bacterium]
MICNACPRNCGIDRSKSCGFCGVKENFVVARAAKHFWEEPPISGTNGSGAVFFSGCNLRCAFCQNIEISRAKKGKEISEERLTEIFDELIASGAHNLNLVTAAHYAEKLSVLLKKYKSKVPVVYNSSGYEKAETLKKLDGAVDIYLPDLKYISSERAGRYSKAEDYFENASKAILEMRRQQPEDIFDENGLMKKGLIIRHLILPKNTNQSKLILDWIKENLGTETYISLMAQYTSCGEIENTPELQRRITEREYEKVLSYCEELGFKNVFVQELDSAKKDFIPDFDLTGV